jgi:large conductance mechanosensitive channel
MLQEFKAFAMRGNIIDLAVGMAIGTAFGTIVTSLVGDVVMPIIGVLSGGLDFSGMKYTMGSATIAYGKFIQAMFIFTVVAAVLFVVVKLVNALKKEEASTPAPAPAPSPDTALLAEIRDLLKKEPLTK